MICFDRASGFADLLRQRGETAGLVVPYLAADQAADVIIQLGEDNSRRQGLGPAMRALADRHFSMPNYIAFIDSLGCGRCR